jgi:hypothetical protein
MALTVHVASFRLMNVDVNGNPIDKNDKSTSISQLSYTRMETLVIPDSSVPNTTGYPTIKEYLEREATDGFKLNHLSQTMVITYLEP